MHYFASDIHLGAGSPSEARATEQAFVAWLNHVATDAKSITLAGDIFDFWFEYHRVVPKGFVRTLGKLAELTDRGITIRFFTGNHDMWITDYLHTECGVEIHTKPCVLELNGKRIFVAHGDNMNIDGQWVLQAMNRAFRSRTLRKLFSWLVHPDQAVRFGRWWSNSSRKKHLAADFDERVTEPLIAYARTHHTELAADHYLFGHMHFPRDYHEEGLHVVLLGTWESGHASYATLDERGNLTLTHQ
ncbi:MAG: UDP-2,3-diacylglucosamine diphosphatase [Alistipes sp.]|nr:UDP-2,3-diacylglucosamine diphosphatase [Alistipes sp.]